MDEIAWKAILDKNEGWNSRHFMSMIATVGIPRSYLDVGCGVGTMVRVARLLGIDAYGVDQLPLPETFFARADLKKRFMLGDAFRSQQAEMVSCLEVAEHLPPECDSIICDTIVDNTLPGGIVIFSSAHPGQEGEDHIGVRPAYYWRKMFHDRGLNYQFDITTRLVISWMNIRSPLMWLAENVQVFTK